jgi:hypothetical protein
MPGYQPPESKLLREFTGNVHKYYTGVNSDRKNDITLIEKMSNTPDETLLGACVLSLEKMKAENGSLPRKVYGTFFKSGSSLENILTTGLNADEKLNILDDKKRLTYLNQMSKYIKSNPGLFDEKDQKSTSNLAQEIKTATDALLKRLQPIIDNTLKRPPTQRALHESFAALAETYEKASSNDFGLASWIGYKDKHAQYAQFIKILNDPELAKYKSPQTEEGIKWPTAYTIPYAAMLHIRNQIAKEYTIRSAKNNSRLHDLCEDGLNLQPDTVVPDEIQDVYLSDLRSVVARLKCDPEAIKLFEKKGFKKAKEFLTTIERELNEQLMALTDPNKDKGPAATRLTNIVTWSAQFGISIVSGNIAARLFPGLSNNILSKTIALVGLIRYGKSGEVVLSNIGGELESRILGTVATVFSTVLDPIGSVAGYLAGEALGVIITAGAKGLELITFNPNINPKFEQNGPEHEWLQTLYDVLPAEKKKILLKITDNLQTEDKPANEPAASKPSMMKLA